MVFISAQLRQRILAEEKPVHYPDVLGSAHNRGRKADKHGNPWRVYELTAQPDGTESYVRRF